MVQESSGSSSGLVTLLDLVNHWIITGLHKHFGRGRPQLAGVDLGWPGTSINSIQWHRRPGLLQEGPWGSLHCLPPPPLKQPGIYPRPTRIYIQAQGTWPTPIAMAKSRSRGCTGARCASSTCPRQALLARSCGMAGRPCFAAYNPQPPSWGPQWALDQGCHGGLAGLSMRSHWPHMHPALVVSSGIGQYRPAAL